MAESRIELDRALARTAEQPDAGEVEALAPKYGTDVPHEPTDEFVVRAFAEGARSLWPDSRDPGWYVTFNRWLAAREAAAGERIAKAIEAKYLGADFGRQYDGRESPDAALHHAYDEGLQEAANLARTTTVTTSSVKSSDLATHPSFYGSPCQHLGPREDCRICPQDESQSHADALAGVIREAQAGDITIPRPQIYTGPARLSVDEATVVYLREAAGRVRSERYWGSGVSRLVADLLDSAADALDRAARIDGGER